MDLIVILEKCFKKNIFLVKKSYFLELPYVREEVKLFLLDKGFKNYLCIKSRIQINPLPKGSTQIHEHICRLRNTGLIEKKTGSYDEVDAGVGRGVRDHAHVRAARLHHQGKLPSSLIRRISLAIRQNSYFSCYHK